MGRQNPDRRNRVYRLALVDNDTHRNIRAIIFTRMGFIIAATTAVVVFVLLVYCFIAFTPLRLAIPGYPDANFKKTALSNAIKIDSLESAVTRWNLYAENLSRVLTGESTIDLDSILGGNAVRYLSDKSAAELSRRDSLLRETVRSEEKFGVSSTSGRSLPVEGLHFFTPIKGVVAGGYDGIARPAIDITAPAGTVVSAVLDGFVVYSGWDDELEYVIVLQHKDNVISIYANNMKVLRKPGDEVKAGSPIALSGGSSAGDGKGSLRFELWHEGRPLNPAQFISF